MPGEQEVFLDMLVAAMKDAATTGHLTQLQTQIDPDGRGIRVVRIIVVPEQMQWQRVDGKPFGS